MVKLRLIGKHSRVVFHQWMTPGEVRELHPDQAAQLEAQYPGEFERTGAPVIQPDYEAAADTQAESEPVNDVIPEVEVPKVEVSDVNPPVDSGRPPAGGRSAPRRRAKR